LKTLEVEKLDKIIEMIREMKKVPVKKGDP